MSDRKKGDDADGTPPSPAKARGGRGGGKSGSGRSGGSGGKARNSNWGRVLRTAYDDTLREPVPDDFHDLLGKLD
ncbi:MAG: NepR family anti-sigma factor [Sphingomicrobium sp.]